MQIAKSWNRLKRGISLKSNRYFDNKLCSKHVLRPPTDVFVFVMV